MTARINTIGETVKIYSAVELKLYVLDRCLRRRNAMMRDDVPSTRSGTAAVVAMRRFLPWVAITLDFGATPDAVISCMVCMAITTATMPQRPPSANDMTPNQTHTRVELVFAIVGTSSVSNRLSNFGL